MARFRIGRTSPPCCLHSLPRFLASGCNFGATARPRSLSLSLQSGKRKGRRRYYCILFFPLCLHIRFGPRFTSQSVYYSGRRGSLGQGKEKRRRRDGFFSSSPSTIPFAPPNPNPPPVPSNPTVMVVEEEEEEGEATAAAAIPSHRVL